MQDNHNETNLNVFLRCRTIVLGGGLSRIDFLYTEGKESVYKETFSKIVRTPILKNKLGDSAGVFGAAMLADIY